MEVILKSIELTDFKGEISKNYQFGKKTFIKGKNGLGKSTIADAFYWMLADKNYSLVSNPNIRPNDGRECVPTVRMVFLIDGKEVEVAKMQKAKYSKPDANGGRKVTLTNTYEVNSVEKTERDFKLYMSDMGFDFEKFLQLSHSDIFIRGMNEKKIRDQMRNTLFSMADNSMSDLDIARLSPETAMLSYLLEKWSIAEVEAKQNATLRKIRENYGKDGEILRANIAGLEKAKVRIDVSAMELGKNSILEQLKENKEKQNVASKLFDEQQKLADGVLQLKFKLGDIQRAADKQLIDQRTKLIVERNSLMSDIAILDGKIKSRNNEISRLSKEIADFEVKRTTAANEWHEIKNMVFDESKTVCSFCKQPYPAERVEDMRSSFENEKEEKLKSIVEKGTSLKHSIEENERDLDLIDNEKAELVAKKEYFEADLSELNIKLAELPSNIDISGTDDYKSIVAQIEEKEAHLKQGKTHREMLNDLQEEENALRSQLAYYEKEIAKASNDDLIEKHIEELRKKQSYYEQSKADCENILEQIKYIYKKKNELFTEQINNHFDIVKWQFFEYQKNGEYKEVCVPLIEGKRLGESTNTGLEVRAKLDIVKGLQKFYGQYYPVFLDGAECLDDESKKLIDMDTQLIMMSVSEDKLLIWEVE